MSSLGDVNPQYITAFAIAGAVDQYAVAELQLPVARIGGSKTKAIVFEILSVDWYLAIEDVGDRVKTNAAFLSTIISRIDGDPSTDGTFATDFARSQNFACAFSHRSQSAALDGGGMYQQFPIHIDTTDGNGNGVLVAVDRLVIVGGNTSGTFTGTYTAKILYRLTEVGIQEYVGIVQSQT